MNKKCKHTKIENEDDIRVSITYGDKPLVDCMRNIIIRRISQKRK